MAAPKDSSTVTTSAPPPEGIGARPLNPPATSGKPIAEFEASLAQDVMKRYKQDARVVSSPIVMPGGMIHDATPYLESRYRTQDHTDLLAGIGKYLTPEWEADHPGYEYVWPAISDKMLGARLRRVEYVAVPASALRDDCPVPFTATTIGPKAEDAIQVFDVCCCAVSPQTYERLFKVKEAMGVAAVAQNYDAFYAGVDREGGKADHWVDRPPR